MEKICILTGLPKEESPIKPMCYNCKDLSFNPETNECICKNQNVMNIGLNKLKEAAANFGFDIDTLVLKPMVLKKPTSKCTSYTPNMNVIQKYVTTLFTDNNETTEA
jgi:hypothetical protein